MKQNLKDITWEDVVKDEVGKIYLDEFDEGIRVLIMRGPASVCMYLGVPKDHPLAGKDYENIPLNCHGGLTFAGCPTSTEKYTSTWPQNYYWYGWDYAHCDDYSVYNDKYPQLTSMTTTKWTPQMVYDDSFGARYDFKKLVKLAEQI